ncbi:cryptochrome/photolyase family protein [Psychroflexus maritimus]|uniref:Deoxyribodipyrimidine photo-lyase n=1 Tax=Psychroflexus maritimus TaxID=2714865 RepID=A0A967ABY0_9FLAO|nr:deoxyribodipyrimidine photo-lyase [Psychroflexus maritimus]NGZ89261.1 deoxyribodipyrimidine photo-lyase [Psychroflexus maritimus]
MKEKVSIFWFRRDLRWEDNVGLYNALQSDYPVIPLFIFDKHILNKLPKNDARVSFIFDELQKMRNTAQEKFASSIAMYHGYPEEVFSQLISEFSIAEVHTNRDYEPYAKKRDAKIEALLAQNGVEFHTYKDQVFFEPNEVQKQDGGMYLVYTPYMKQWKKIFEDSKLTLASSENHLNKLYKNSRLPNLSLADMDFEKSEIQVPNYQLNKNFIEDYESTRDIPSIEGTSRLSPHLRFGTVGYRKILQQAMKSKNEIFWNELIWREFYKAILYHFPETVNRSFKPKYDQIEWRNNEDEFEKWKQGKTGYPIVDAGMRQLNETGWMHNRIRMIVGSFLCKHLLIDWRWGEAYFAEKLLDYEMSSNIGGWQWIAGSGVDAAPYFRVFNPYSQTDKFDKQKKYINKWVAEINTSTYPEPMVEHKMARQRCLATYKLALKS